MTFLAGDLDANMFFSTVAKLKVPYIMMHMQKSTKHAKNPFTSIHVKELIPFYFAEKIEKLLGCEGVKDLIIDPGLVSEKH